jgi:hypothetical protein
LDAAFWAKMGWSDAKNKHKKSGSLFIIFILDGKKILNTKLVLRIEVRIK